MLLCPSCLQPPTIAPAYLWGYEIWCVPCCDLGAPNAWGRTEAKAISAWNDVITDYMAAREMFEVYVPEDLMEAA